MKSKWFEYKQIVIDLRRKGISITAIEKEFSIPRSTLSGWFKGIELSVEQKQKIVNARNEALVVARKKAVAWHNTQKAIRLQEAKKSAQETLDRINSADFAILELAASILYLGEGAKKSIETVLGSSDPLILKFFLRVLRDVYAIQNSKIRCELYLRADQDPEEIKGFWSHELDIPVMNFKQVNFDKRTIGSVTYPDYKGVCSLRCGSVAIQRKLMALSELFCKTVINKPVLKVLRHEENTS